MVQKIYRLPEVMSHSLSRSSIYLQISKRIPKAFEVGRRAVGWTEDAIVDWQQTLMKTQNESVMHLQVTSMSVSNIRRLVRENKFRNRLHLLKIVKDG